MVPRLTGASLGLLAFAIAVLAGLFVGNPALVILSRAILSLFVFFVVGLVLGSAAQRVLEDRHRVREQELIRRYQSPVEDEGGGPQGQTTVPEQQRVAGAGVTA